MEARKNWGGGKSLGSLTAGQLTELRVVGFCGRKSGG